MDEQTFWALVGTIGHDPGGYDRLADALSDRSAADIYAFADRLAAVLYALDTPAHYRAAGVTATVFVSVRCAAVAAGPAAYRRMLATPDELAGCRPGGAHLLAVPARAYRRATRRTWAHRPPTGTETGDNAPAWTAYRWLHPHLGATTRDGRAPQAYMAALRHVTDTLNADPRWQAWWRSGGMADCELGIVAESRLDHLRPSADISRDGDRVRANFTCPHPDQDGPAAALLPTATAEVAGMFEVIREAIGLPALPVLPAVPDLGDDARDLELTTRPLPSEPTEMDQQGYLTLTQIQEFFG